MTCSAANRRARPARRVSTYVKLALAVLAGQGCTADQALFGAGLPGAELSVVVSSVRERGDYLDARVQGNGLPLRFFARTGWQDCAQILRDGAALTYVDSGLRGELRSGSQRCAPQGYGSYRIDVGRTPRAAGRDSLAQRSQAAYSRIYEDEGGYMLRGRFPGASFVGWNGSLDTIVVVPKTPVCADVAGREVASLEFRSLSKRRLLLLSAEGLCPVEGLVMP